MLFTTRLGLKGELTIPAVIRNDWKLKYGEELIIEKIGSEMIIMKSGSSKIPFKNRQV